MTADLNWILDKLVQVPHARHAVLLSADGLLRANSDGVGRDMADTVAAICSGMQALSRAADQFVSDGGSPWQQTLMQFGDGFVLLMAAGNGAFLVVSASGPVDVAILSYEMSRTVDGLQADLAVLPRPPLASGA